MAHFLSASSRYYNWGKLGFLAAPVIAICWRQPLELPSLWHCPIRSSIGCPCPSCGMTRAILAIGRGQWQAAGNYHAFSFVLVGGCCLVASHAALELMRNRSIQLKFNHPKLYLVLGLIYFLYYFYRLFYQLIP